MKVIRNINLSDTLRSIPVGEFLLIPGKDIKDPSYLRSLSVRLPGKYTVNKLDRGASYKVTRLW